MDFTEWDTRLSAYAVITDGHGHILLTWFNGAAPLWTLPGGGVEFEESLEAAVAREVFGETGFHVAVGRPLFSSTMTADVGSRSPRPFKAVRIIFEATIVGGELGTTEIGGELGTTEIGGTTDEARWMPLTGLPDHEPRAGIVDQAYESLRRTTGS
ncbi:NUDIX hydrolase [Brachybacterium tyrofermentans]|uniref:NUDIX hydrolase n=1 Tax=Brachybacterium tyrofermentans TaxID=47848 RepID=UPI003FCFCAE2